MDQDEMEVEDLINDTEALIDESSVYRVNPEHFFVLPNGVRLQLYFQEDLAHIETFKRRVAVSELSTLAIIHHSSM